MTRSFFGGISALLGLLLSSLSAGAWGSASFSDTTFNLGDYALTQFASNQTITASQITSGGNPGAAFQAQFAAGSGTSTGLLYAINTAFSYDPTSQGAITQVDFSQDGYVTTTVPLGGFGERLIVEQAGEFYEYTVVTGTSQGVYMTAQANGLTAASFSQITDLSTFATDASLHPSFTNGALRFGFLQAWVAIGAYPANTTIERLDNFSVTIHSTAPPVPEPSSTLLLSAGLIAVGFSVSRRHSVRPAEGTRQVSFRLFFHGVEFGAEGRRTDRSAVALDPWL